MAGHGKPGKARTGGVLGQARRFFLDLFPFIPERARPFFALVVALLFTLLCVLVATHQLQRDWVGVVNNITWVLDILLGIASLAFLAVLLWGQQLTQSERLVVQQILNRLIAQ